MDWVGGVRDSDIRAPITVEEARRVVAYIRDVAGDDDDEVAHAREDSLRRAVLETIATAVVIDHDNDDTYRELARVALSTSDIEFSRWCA